ncbi:IS1634 family transposase [Methanosarcina mazei]|uniref:Transposase n=1 Tax=Methanosarcina mazei TaxID=2209 RepID=A0A0F8I322_METMZ|nr:IS1634 family transposase [Methanosarcina mazei]KKG51870.1 transposase [Methanosarcina mazei]KKG57938.1 transposase [Methanosarcina mazei]KKG58259.1 transposase [Methanosarcina mazei]KKG97923.1 transposase [Methanosarcina mazei]KKG98265.1 transposase [Methanosarcina mazei]
MAEKNSSRRVESSFKRTKFLGHLGLMAGVFRELEVDKLIDEKLPKERNHNVPHSVCILAMVLNGLGFVGQRLYLFPDFFKNISTERLFGDGITKEDLNQYAIGETLDRIVKYGPTKLFTEISLHIMTRLPIPVHCLHADTTSVSVFGDYEDEETESIDITFGIPKNGRWDLKQFVLSLIVNQHGIPLFMNKHSGNASDKKTILEAIKSLKSVLRPESKVYYVADSSFYTDNNIQNIGKSFWISRVPATITEAKELLAANLNLQKLKSDERYSFYQTFVEYGGIKQKWVLLLSHKMKEKKEGTLRTKLDKEVEKAEKSFKKLKGEDFFCEEDALKAAEKWITDFPSVSLEKVDVKSIKKRESGKRGRPSKDEELKTYFKIDGIIKVNDTFVLKEMEKMGLFILASNDISLSPEEMLKYYKGQDNVEKGFRFLKSDTFSISKVYLKNKSRIEALTMIMVLCLMIYSIAEWKLRIKLEEENETIPDQKGKPTKRPTMRWIFFNFQGITELRIQKQGEIESEILNMEDLHWKILSLMGEKYENIYL